MATGFEIRISPAISVRSIVGSILGAIVLTVLPEALRGFAEYRMVIYSLLLIILMITRPQGLLGSTGALKAWRKRAKRVAESAGAGPAAAPTNPSTVATQPERPAPGGENLR